jgi:hypothetical protein
MHYVMGDLVIARPVTEVFDVVAAKRSELSDPHGLDGLVTHTAVQRPEFISWTIASSRATASGTLRFEPVVGGTRLRWCWTVRPRGAWRLVAAVLMGIGERRQQRLWAALKEEVETMPWRETVPENVVPPSPRSSVPVP